MHREHLLKTMDSGIIPNKHLSVKEVLTLSEEELYHNLMCALKQLNMPLDEVTIKFRPYSKTYYGRYFPDSNRIFIYPYNDEDGNFMSFTSILCTTIHEMVHHIQHQDPNFKRQKGIMHDPKFWELYNHFLDRAVSKSILVREEIENIG